MRPSSVHLALHLFLHGMVQLHYCYRLSETRIAAQAPVKYQGELLFD